MNKKHNSRGFTFLEVMTVVVLLGILAALIQPSFTSLLANIRLQSARELVKRQLLAARYRAISNPAIHCGVFFRSSGTLYTGTLAFYDDGGGSKNDNAYNEGSDGIFQPFDTLPNGVTLTMATVNPIVNNVVIFRGDGSALNGGNVLIRNAYRTDTINILASTGRVKAY